MNKSLMLFMSVVGLALATANPGFARGNDGQLHSGTATGAANNHTGQASPLSSSVGGYYLALAANHESRDTTTLNTSLAILAGVFTLMLLQRRNHTHIILRPRH